MSLAAISYATSEVQIPITSQTWMTTIFSSPLMTGTGFLFIIKVIHAHYRQFGDFREGDRE